MFIYRLSLLLIGLAVSGACSAATPLEEIRIFGDRDVRIPFEGGGNIGGDDEILFIVNPALGNGNAFALLPGNLFGDPYEVDAHDLNGGNRFSVDIAADINGFVVRPADVFTLSGGGTVVFDGVAEGLPPNVNVDAISTDSASGDLILSFDQAVSASGIGFVAADLVRFTGSAFSLFFDGFRVSRNLNLDAAHVLDNGNILMSFASGGSVDGVAFQDDDIVEYDPVADTFELVFTMAALNETWQPADVNALWAERRIQGGQVRLSTDLIRVLENEGPVSVNVLREGGSEGATVVNWTTMAGSAGTSDFVMGGGSISYNDGDGAIRTLTVNLSDDALQEGIEEFTIEVSVASGSATLGAPSATTVRILDDETFIFVDSFEDE